MVCWDVALKLRLWVVGCGLVCKSFESLSGVLEYVVCEVLSGAWRRVVTRYYALGCLEKRDL